MQASRYSWEWHRGPIPAGKHVLHRCDNPLCVNPEHLYVGSHADNMSDRQSRNRQARGVRHGLSKLNDEAVKMMRKEHAGGKSIYSLSKETGINETTISRAVRGITWSHVK